MAIQYSVSMNPDLIKEEIGERMLDSMLIWHEKEKRLFLPAGMISPSLRRSLPAGFELHRMESLEDFLLDEKDVSWVLARDERHLVASEFLYWLTLAQKKIEWVPSHGMKMISPHQKKSYVQAELAKAQEVFLWLCSFARNRCSAYQLRNELTFQLRRKGSWNVAARMAYYKEDGSLVSPDALVEEPYSIQYAYEWGASNITIPITGVIAMGTVENKLVSLYNRLEHFMEELISGLEINETISRIRDDFEEKAKSELGFKTVYVKVQDTNCLVSSAFEEDAVYSLNVWALSSFSVPIQTYQIFSFRGRKVELFKKYPKILIEL